MTFPTRAIGLPSTWKLVGVALIIVLILVLIGFGAGYWKGNVSGKNSIQKEWDAERVVMKAERIEQQAKFMAMERGWIDEKQKAQDKADADRAATQADMDSTIAGIRSDNDRLRDRFKACQSKRMPADPGATGRSEEASEGGLSKSDEEFLVRIAAEADQVVHTLTECQNHVLTITQRSHE